jgi:hypothetical protein
MAMMRTRPACLTPRMRHAIAGALVPGTVLARFPTAVYVAVPRAFGVLAILSPAAVRLPCGVQILDGSLPGGDVVVGAGAVRVGDVVIRPGRVVSASVARQPAPSARRLDEARRLVPSVEIDERLLGRGPGLTPSGDDVLAGYLVGAAAFGVPADDVRRLVESQAAARTTTLSAALLRHAAAGETIPQVIGLLDALAGRRPFEPALADLRAVGHTSGAALASGVLAAALGAPVPVVAA